MDLEIPVEFKGQPKWITGLSRGTTCDDVIYALLRHDLGPNQNIDVSSYRMYEEWNDCERTLSGRTKIMKLWRALGSEARNVRLVIRVAHTADILDTGSEMSYGTRTRRAKRQSKTHSPFKHQHKLSALSKSEIYEYYYRKEKRRRDSDHKVGLRDSYDELYSYVAMVSKQEEQLEKIASQISNLDASISQYEVTQVLYYPNSQNDHSESTTSLFPAIKANDVEAYLHMCESLVDIHEQIEQTHSKACYLASVLAHEQSAKIANSQNSSPLPTNHAQIQQTISNLHEELEKCATLSLMQQNEMDLLEEALCECETRIPEKQNTIQQLTLQLETEEQSQNGGDLDTLKDNYTTPVSNYYETSNHLPVPNQSFNGKSRSLSNIELNNIHKSTNGHSGVYNVPQNEIKTQTQYSSNPTILSDHLSKRNASNKKISERTKGVRFKMDVTKWMYDVLSEDDSQWESAGSDILPINNQYSKNLENKTTSSNNSLNSNFISKPILTSNNAGVKPILGKNTTTIFAPNKNLFAKTCSLQEATMVPYTTYIRPGSIATILGADDSNSDTGLSSMNSEEEALMHPLETLV